MDGNYRFVVQNRSDHIYGGGITVAVCKNHVTGEICPYFHECKHENEVAPKTNKKMKQYSLYCLHGIRVRKIAGKADWTGRTPKWCPLGRTE